VSSDIDEYWHCRVYLTVKVLPTILLELNRSDRHNWNGSTHKARINRFLSYSKLTSERILSLWSYLFINF